MQNLTTTAVLVSLVLVAGCATRADAIVEIGTDTYKVGSAGRFSDYTDGAIKARLYQEAYRHCAAQNRLMVLVNSAGQMSASASAPAELQFRCLARNEAHLPSTPVPTL